MNDGKEQQQQASEATSGGYGKTVNSKEGEVIPPHFKLPC